MKTILYGMLIGIGKIIPGVSGALIAVSLGIYEKAINSLANFFDDWKNNTKFIFQLGLGIIISIILFSKLILLLITKYYLVSVMFFIGLIAAETFKYARKVKYNKNNIIVIAVSLIIFLLIPKINILRNAKEIIMYFISGIIEIFSSLIPGISGTSLLMSINMYDKVLLLISNIYNYNFIIINFKLYLSYTLGMLLSFILNITIINYLFKNKRNLMESIILSLSIGSIIAMFQSINYNFDILTIIFSIIFFFSGLILAIKF